MRVLGLLVVAAVVIWALIEAIQADSRAIRRLPKAAWIVIIIVLAPFGSLGWFLFGRPKVAVNTPGRSAPPQPGPRPGWGAQREQTARPAPDDDPEFLRRLSQQAEQQKKLRLLEEGRSPEKPGKPEPRPEAEGPDEGSAPPRPTA